MSKEDREIWKNIPSHPDYEVSNLGNIRTRKPINRNASLGNFRPIKPQLAGTNNQYRMFCARNLGKQSTVLIHRAVLEAFVGPCPEGMEACHNDGNGSNNVLSNLRWDTRSNNTHDQIKHGVHVWVKTPEKRNKRRLNDDQVQEAKKYLQQGLSQREVANIMGVSQPCICRVNKGLYDTPAPKKENDDGIKR